MYSNKKPKSDEEGTECESLSEDILQLYKDFSMLEQVKF